MQIQIGPGASAPDYAKHLCGAEAPLITRKLNAPSELICKLLIRGLDVVAPAVGQEISVARASSEKLFTGVIESVEDEYLGWSSEGPVYALQVRAKSSESFAGQGSAPGNMSEAVHTNAADMLKAQMPGIPFMAGENGTVGTTALPAMRVDAGESVAAVLGRASDQGRLSYRVHDGVLVVNEVGAMMHPAHGSPLQRYSAARKSVSVVARGAEEAQEYVTELIACNGGSALIPLSGRVFAGERHLLLHEVFAAGSKLQIVGASVAPGTLHTDPNTQCDVRIGAAIELGGRLLLEISGVNVQSCGSAALIGFIEGAATLPHCTAGFQLSGGPAGLQISAIIGGVLNGPPLMLNPSSTYTLRVRLYAPEQVRRTQLVRGFTGTIGGREISSWASVHCEVVEEGNSQVMTEVASDTLVSVPASAAAVVCHGAAITASLSAVKLVSGPAFEVRYTPRGGAERMLRVGAKSDGAEAWLSKGQLKLGWKPAVGDVVKVRYRQGGRASALGASDGGGQNAVAVRLEAPLMRSTEDCENAVAMMIADANSSAANAEGELQDEASRFGTGIWPGDAVVLDNTAVVVREVKIKPVSLVADVFELALKFANDAAEPIAMKAVKSSSIVTPRGMAGTQYGDNLSDVQVVSATTSAVQLQCGALATGAHIEVRSSPEGWGTGGGLVASTGTTRLSINGDATTGEWFLKQVDASGNYSRETAIVRTSL